MVKVSPSSSFDVDNFELNRKLRHACPRIKRWKSKIDDADGDVHRLREQAINRSPVYVAIQRGSRNIQIRTRTKPKLWRKWIQEGKKYGLDVSVTFWGNLLGWLIITANFRHLSQHRFTFRPTHTDIKDKYRSLNPSHRHKRLPEDHFQSPQWRQEYIHRLKCLTLRTSNSWDHRRKNTINGTCLCSLWHRFHWITFSRRRPALSVNCHPHSAKDDGWNRMLDCSLCQANKCTNVCVVAVFGFQLPVILTYFRRHRIWNRNRRREGKKRRRNNQSTDDL